MKRARHRLAAKLTATILGLAPLAASSAAQPPNTPLASAPLGRSESGTSFAPLPLRIPILAVMLGSMNRSASEIFRAATLLEERSDEEWLKLGAAAVDQGGAATLSTVPGPSAKDAAWGTEPRWDAFAREMQNASIAIGAATTRRDRAAFGLEASRLAQSCQSCHLTFSTRLLNSSDAVTDRLQQ